MHMSQRQVAIGMQIIKQVAHKGRSCQPPEDRAAPLDSMRG